jgi:hypothetical protein
MHRKEDRWNLEAFRVYMTVCARTVRGGTSMGSSTHRVARSNRHQTLSVRSLELHILRGDPVLFLRAYVCPPWSKPRANPDSDRETEGDC